MSVKATRIWQLLSLFAAFAIAAPAALVPVVVQGAEHAGRGRSYCIEIAAENGYRPADSLLDLTGYRMRASGGYRDSGGVFHAVLFAARPEAAGATWGQARYERFNWSYRHFRFTPISGQGHAGLGDRPSCAPRSSFARTLPLLP